MDYFVIPTRSPQECKSTPKDEKNWSQWPKNPISTTARGVNPYKFLIFVWEFYNWSMTISWKTYPLWEFSWEEKAEIEYIQKYEPVISHEELMYLRQAKEEYAL